LHRDEQLSEVHAPFWQVFREAPLPLSTHLVAFSWQLPVGGSEFLNQTSGMQTLMLLLVNTRQLRPLGQSEDEPHPLKQDELSPMELLLRQ